MIREVNGECTDPPGRPPRWQLALSGRVYRRGRNLLGHPFLGLGLQHLPEQGGIGFQSSLTQAGQHRPGEPEETAGLPFAEEGDAGADLGSGRLDQCPTCGLGTSL